MKATSTQINLFSERTGGGAVLSPCGRYRYRLWREFGDLTKRVLFCMLNPSTADHMEDDPTITRCMAFAHAWGFGALDVCNMFAWRSTDMKVLAEVDDPIGTLDLGVGNNDSHIAALAAAAGRVVLAWGNGHRSFQRLHNERAIAVTNLVTQHAKVLPLAFRMTKAGQPEHPLYQRTDAQLIPVHGLELLRPGFG